MRALNLPEFDSKLKKSEGKVWIFDVIRKKFVVLTPEEWVRQHLIHYLIAHLGYPRALVKIETGLQYNSLQKRSDIVVYDREGKPWMIVECKSFEVELDQKSIHQVAAYNTTIRAPYVVVSNGLRHVCYQVSESTKEVVPLKSFPEYQ